MDLALNNLQRLICQKPNKPINLISTRQPDLVTVNKKENLPYSVLWLQGKIERKQK